MRVHRSREQDASQALSRNLAELDKALKASDMAKIRLHAPLAKQEVEHAAKKGPHGHHGHTKRTQVGASSELARQAKQAMAQSIEALRDAVRRGDFSKAHELSDQAHKSVQQVMVQVGLKAVHNAAVRMKTYAKERDGKAQAEKAKYLAELDAEEAEDAAKATPAPKNKALSDKSSLKVCDVDNGAPEDMLKALRECADKLDVFAKAVEVKREESIKINKDLGEIFQKAESELRPEENKAAIAKALEKDHDKAEKFLVSEIGKADADDDKLKGSGVGSAALA